MAISKIILNGVTQMDVTQDTVASSNLLSGYTATKNDGTKVSGSYVPPSAPTLQSKTKTYTPTTSQQTETITADSGYDGLEEVDITVNAIQTETKSAIPSESAQTITPSSGKYLTSVSVGAIASNYVGSGITQRSSSDLTASGATVTVPSGYYSAQASKAVASGTAGTPTATKGTVSNHSVSVTPSVTNTTGYITGGTKTGTAVSVSASELVSGTKSITANGTSDVTDYASVNVNVTPQLINLSKSYTLTTQTHTDTINTETGYDGINKVNISIEASSGTAGTPTATKGTVSNHSVSVTPSVTNTTGWITGSTKTGTAVTVSASELVSGSQTITDNGTVNVTNLASVTVALDFSTIYTGSSNPSSSTGSNGDIYLKI